VGVSTPYRCYGVNLAFNPAVYCIYTAFLAVTLWIATDLLLNVFTIFERWTTMYFW
jgi:hypothetical protein